MLSDGRKPKAEPMPLCWPVRMTSWLSPRSASARTTGRSLIASGRVPTIETIRPARPVSAATGHAELGGGLGKPRLCRRISLEGFLPGAERCGRLVGFAEHHPGAHQAD